jgi:hypothetical protein
MVHLFCLFLLFLETVSPQNPYNAESDSYQCSAGNPLKRSGSQKKGDKLSHKYAAKASVCKACPLAKQCLLAKIGYRLILSVF